MRRFALVFLLLMVVPATAQEHAPTFAQCEADADLLRLTNGGASDGLPTSAPPKPQLTWNEANERTVEMAECMTITPQTAKYRNAATALSKLMASVPGTGDPVNDLRLVLSSEQTSQSLVPKFKLELRDVGDSTFLLDLGL